MTLSIRHWQTYITYLTFWPFFKNEWINKVVRFLSNYFYYLYCAQLSALCYFIVDGSSD